jgi:hypothetical protein
MVTKISFITLLVFISKSGRGKFSSSNKGSNCIPPLRNSINDENFDDIVYGDEDKCDLLNKYFSLVSKLEEENMPLPDFDIKTNNLMNEVFVIVCKFCTKCI